MSVNHNWALVEDPTLLTNAVRALEPMAAAFLRQRLPQIDERAAPQVIRAVAEFAVYTSLVQEAEQIILLAFKAAGSGNGGGQTG